MSYRLALLLLTQPPSSVQDLQRTGTRYPVRVPRKYPYLVQLVCIPGTGVGTYWVPVLLHCNHTVGIRVPSSTTHNVCTRYPGTIFIYFRYMIWFCSSWKWKRFFRKLTWTAPSVNTPRNVGRVVLELQLPQKISARRGALLSQTD